MRREFCNPGTVQVAQERLLVHRGDKRMVRLRTDILEGLAKHRNRGPRRAAEELGIRELAIDYHDLRSGSVKRLRHALGEPSFIVGLNGEGAFQVPLQQVGVAEHYLHIHIRQFRDVVDR